jgi:hypothetical protein
MDEEFEACAAGIKDFVKVDNQWREWMRSYAFFASASRPQVGANV